MMKKKLKRRKPMANDYSLAEKLAFSQTTVEEQYREIVRLNELIQELCKHISKMAVPC